MQQPEQQNLMLCRKIILPDFSSLLLLAIRLPQKGAARCKFFIYLQLGH